MQSAARSEGKKTLMLRTASKLQIRKHQRNFRARAFRRKEEAATKLQVLAERIIEDKAFDSSGAFVGSEPEFDDLERFRVFVLQFG